MRIAVIIAEYNPFHNGHAYHIAQTRKNGATHIAVVMSGNFVQRGEPAFLEKHVRARAALSGGADLVLELPLAFACAPAQRFGLGAVYVAEKMGCVDMLSFGSESGDTARLEQAAAVLDTPQFREALALELESGAPYPQAVSRAMERCGSGFAGLTASPNDTLALEYLRALRQLGSKIRPMAVQRAFVEHDAEEAAESFASASRLRALAQPEKIAAYVPEEAAQLYRAELEAGHTPDPQRLDAAVLGVLRRQQREEFSRLPDLSEGIENRFWNAMRSGSSMEEILTLAKTKRYPHARLRRMMMHAFLGVTQEMAEELPAYLRVLGANERGREILSVMAGTASLPVSASLAELERSGPTAAKQARLEALSTDLYQGILRCPGPCATDYTAPAIWNA